MWLKDERESAFKELGDARLKLDEETKSRAEAVH